MSAAVGAPEERRTTLSRVPPVTGRGRRAGLVAPSGEPVGALLPELLRLLGERPAGPGAQRLATADGAVLAPHDSLALHGSPAAARLADGAELPLVQAPFTPGTRPGRGLAADVAAPLLAALLRLLCLLAALPVTLLALRTMDPPRTALRRAVARTESAAVVALIPVTVGALGGYALLRDAF
ncbi:EsaB/YukD family protein [Streptomyces sp. NPDC059080]|uniref:EsaB/YukD family protein n=1 Tax=Streptomyces sp. NPDC059080 TaxID=3346718 RepID=UPI00367BFD72